MILGERDPEVKAGVQDVDMSGQTVLVTGSTSGVGRQAAMAMGRLGADVIVHGRDQTAGESAVRELDGLGSDAQFVSADYTDVDAVREMAAEVEASVDEIDVLCNNAGGLFEDGETTELGVDRNFHINHLSPFLLTTELLDTLAPDARVVTTASIGHRVSSLNLDALIEPSPFSEWAAYCRSKLANIHFANELARRLDNAGSDVTSNSFHPGIIPGSEFSRALPGPVQQVTDLLDDVPLTDSPEDGAATMTYLAASGDVEGDTGKYYARCRKRRPAPDARDETAQRDLWKRSADLLGIEEPLAEYA
ncbi:SDR family NAD(P)-dependent oxidoreductase [Halorientalis pallida]|uniref:SDR family NAD(P)-dependent oxidoreductase n=1 Tax=Halorientalis pallida TaxID=2479928 RepID=UPI003C6EAC0B